MRPARRVWRQICLLVVAALLLGACNMKYRRFSRRAELIGAAVAVEQSPRVQLEFGHGGEPQAGVTEPGEQARTGFEAFIYLATGVVAASVVYELERRFRRVMPRPEIETVIRRTVAKQLASGQPFGYAGDTLDERPDGTLFVDVVRYGIVSADNGPAFVVDLRFRIYEAGNNDLVYEEAVSCRDPSFFLNGYVQESVTRVALVSFFRSMEDRELRERASAVFESCTAKMVAKLRDDAG